MSSSLDHRSRSRQKSWCSVGHVCGCACRFNATCRRILEKGFPCPGFPHHVFKAYESNIDFEIRSVKVELKNRLVQGRIRSAKVKAVKTYKTLLDEDSKTTDSQLS